MTADPQLRRSPLAHCDEMFAALRGVTIREVPFLVQVSIRVGLDSAARGPLEEVLGTKLPADPGTSMRSAQLEVLWLGPDEWLAVAHPGSRPDLYEELRLATGSAPAAVDVSAQRTCVAISGATAAELLSRGCAVDLHPSVSPAGTCVQTLLARAGVILLVDGPSQYRLLVRSSFADYVARWLCDAGAEYQLVPP